MSEDGKNDADQEIEIWSGGLKWALEKGYRKSETLGTVREELGLWLENLDELIDVFGPKAEVGEVLEKAADDEDDLDTSFDADDDGEDD